MNTHNWRKMTVVLLIFVMLAAGCGGPGPAAGGGEALEGTIAVSGAWALYPMMVRWSEEFQKLHPGVKFDISAGGAGKGMADALTGAADIGMVSREIYPEEVEKGAFWVPVTRDAVFLAVNEKNPVWEDLHQQGIDRETLVGIYITGEITTWGQVVGRPEVTEPIHVFTRSDAAGAPATWAAYLGKQQEDLLGVGVYGDPGLLEAVVKDPLGIGYNNLNYAFDMETGQPVSGARVVYLDANENGRADAEEIYDTKDQAVGAVANGAYPSPPARDLNLVTQGKPAGIVNSFMRWVLTDGQQFVEEAGYIPLREEQLQAGLEKLK
jgi:phosphate transport system substrate-binding protein